MVTPSGIIIVVIFVLKNAPSPISFNDDGNIIFVNCEQSEKHLFPILVTPSGIIQLPFSISNGYSLVLQSIFLLLNSTFL